VLIFGGGVGTIEKLHIGFVKIERGGEIETA
jgi:hypothetical protein